MPYANDKRFNAVSVGPLGYGPRIFLQQVWDMMSQNITSTDSPGKKQMELLTNSYQNFIHWTSNIFLTFSISSSLSNGSLSVLYLLFVIVRRARFCSLNILFNSKPHHVIPNSGWDNIKESYMSFLAENWRYLFSLFITPCVREFPLVIVVECELQFINSSIVKPRKLKHETRPIFLSLICKSGIASFNITL